MLLGCEHDPHSLGELFDMQAALNAGTAARGALVSGPAIETFTRGQTETVVVRRGPGGHEAEEGRLLGGWYLISPRGLVLERTDDEARALAFVATGELPPQRRGA